MTLIQLYHYNNNNNNNNNSDNYSDNYNYNVLLGEMTLIQW